MLVILSPAKNMNFDPPTMELAHTKPDFIKDARELVGEARKLSKGQIKKLMNISDKLAELNYERFQAFKTPFTPDNAKQAALAFNGDVYIGLEANTLSADDLDWAQDRLRILSGLFGMLRPLDLIQPYRLEMGRPLKTAKAGDLHEFWQDKLTRKANALLKDMDDPTLVNLASNEYFASINADKIKGRVLTCQFKEIRDGKARFLMFFAKKARGLMARYIIDNRIDEAEGLKGFDLEGYGFNGDLSDDNTWVFTRKSKKK